MVHDCFLAMNASLVPPCKLHVHWCFLYHNFCLISDLRYLFNYVQTTSDARVMITNEEFWTHESLNDLLCKNISNDIMSTLSISGNSDFIKMQLILVLLEKNDNSVTHPRQKRMKSFNGQFQSAILFNCHDHQTI